MGCVSGKSYCETCGNEFEWTRHSSQAKAKFCSRKCTNKDFGVKGNAGRLFWPTATDEEKKDRYKRDFFNKVLKKDGCWEWKGYVDKNGYAQINGHNGKTFVPIKAHRVSYEIHVGKILDGMIVCHTCDNPVCTNPEHLWIGTQKENGLDRKKKGRSCRGESRWNSVLKEDDVRNIRKSLSIGISIKYLSEKYNVHYATISLISKNRTWKHVA